MKRTVTSRCGRKGGCGKKSRGSRGTRQGGQDDSLALPFGTSYLPTLCAQGLLNLSFVGILDKSRSEDRGRARPARFEVEVHLILRGSLSPAGVVHLIESERITLAFPWLVILSWRHLSALAEKAFATASVPEVTIFSNRCKNRSMKLS